MLSELAGRPLDRVADVLSPHLIHRATCSLPTGPLSSNLAAVPAAEPRSFLVMDSFLS